MAIGDGGSGAGKLLVGRDGTHNWFDLSMNIARVSPCKKPEA